MRSVSLLVYKAVDGAIEVGPCAASSNSLIQLCFADARCVATRNELKNDGHLSLHHAAHTLALRYRRSRETTTRTG